MANETIDISKLCIVGVIQPFLATFGTLGNLLAITVLCSKKLECVRSLRHLFIQLAIFDTLVIVVQAVIFCPGYWSEYYRNHLHQKLIWTLSVASNLGITGSSLTTLGISIERYLSICHTINCRRVTLFYTVPIFLTSVVVSTFPYFMTTYDSNGLLQLVFPWADWIFSIFQFYLPGFFLIIFNFLIFKKIHTLSKDSTNQRRNHKIAMMLLVVVVVYILCYFLRDVLYGYALNNIAILIAHLLITINSSVNILIYYFHDEHFRNVAEEILGLQQACQKSRKPTEENCISLETILTPLSRE